MPLKKAQQVRHTHTHNTNWDCVTKCLLYLKLQQYWLIIFPISWAEKGCGESFKYMSHSNEEVGSTTQFQFCPPVRAADQQRDCSADRDCPGCNSAPDQWGAAFLWAQRCSAPDAAPQVMREALQTSSGALKAALGWRQQKRNKTTHLFIPQWCRPKTFGLTCFLIIILSWGIDLNIITTLIKSVGRKGSCCLLWKKDHMESERLNCWKHCLWEHRAKEQQLADITAKCKTWHLFVWTAD